MLLLFDLVVLSSISLLTIWLRYYLKKEKPHGLVRLVSAVTWTNTRQVAEMHKMLESWPLINPRYALGLLVPQFADSRVRGFAIKCLNQLTDHQLGVYMLQLTSALKCVSFLLISLLLYYIIL